MFAALPFTIKHQLQVVDRSTQEAPRQLTKPVVNRYAGFNEMFRDGWADKRMTRANCWAYARRQFFELVDVARQLKRRKGGAPLVLPLAKEALNWIDQIFGIEREINGRTAAERLSVRQERVAPLVHALEAWMREKRGKKRGSLSRHDPVAKAIAYLLNDLGRIHGILRRRADLPDEQCRRTRVAQPRPRQKGMAVHRLGSRR